MFEFKGTGNSTEGDGLDSKVVDHSNVQDMGQRPFPAMPQSAHHQRAKTEGARRPSLQLRLRSNSSAPSYSRPQDRDDLSPAKLSSDRRTPHSLLDRRSFSGGSLHTRGDSLDSFAPKAWMAKGSRFLKRQNSKQELTSLRTLDWVEEASEDARVQHLLYQSSPPRLTHSRVRSTGDPNAVRRLNISKPFNFHHVTHTQAHHVQKLETADPNDLASEFFALRASQASQPELRGIKARDIQREDLPQDALLPDSPSQPRDYPTTSPSRFESYGQDTPYGVTFPENLGPIATYRTPDIFTFHDESPSDTSFESTVPTDSPEPLDYSIGTWNNGYYDLSSPHAVTTDDGADWNRQVPFAMVKTELAPVEEDDERDEHENLAFAYHRAPKPDPPGRRYKNPFQRNMFPFREDLQCERAQTMPPAQESPCRLSDRLLPAEEDVLDSVHTHRMSQIKISEPCVEDPLDDISTRPRFSRPLSVGPNDMEGFWDMASDAINCSYALGAEGDSNFDWLRSSVHEEDVTPHTTDDIQTDATDKAFNPPKGKPQHASPSPTRHAAKRSSSVYSSTSPFVLPLQTFPSKQDPPLAGSAEPPVSSIPGAVNLNAAPDSTMVTRISSAEPSVSSIPGVVTLNAVPESTMFTRISPVNCKEWGGLPTYILSNDSESQTIQDDPYLYHQTYTSDYSQDAPLQLHHVGRIDGSTISNSPRSSRSPISKSSSQESFWYTQAASNARRPRNAGSIGSLPESMSKKNSRERFDSAVDQLTDSLPNLTSSDLPPDSQQIMTAQRRPTPQWAIDAVQNVLSKVRSTEEPMPLLSASRDRAISDVTPPAQDSSMPPPAQPAPGRRTRSGSSTSSSSARGSRGSYSIFPPPHTPPTRSP
ncbi:hypothetical protein IMSHALPRED_000052 [Imshaugia aleurites]|uniref:CRIB domain-containing protein n=1 Tax=Imshaugia aleurites TaxID=172621 RepID=A0A8H3HVS6_9LECA|nr:hypothetical protein IMSHALPRED_000052 [Imshaugia aleurites]